MDEVGRRWLKAWEMIWRGEATCCVWIVGGKTGYVARTAHPTWDRV